MEEKDLLLDGQRRGTHPELGPIETPGAVFCGAVFDTRSQSKDPAPEPALGLG